MSTVGVMDQPELPSIRPSLLANPLVEWLLTKGWPICCPKDLVGRFAWRMVETGIPVYRLRVTVRILHPQFVGTTYRWRLGVDQVEEFTPPHAILQEDRFLKSPYAPVFEGAGGVRRRLDVPGVELDFPILKDLQGEGATDYVAMPLVFSDGRINAVTLASTRPGGFSTEELETVYGALPILARLLEVHALRRTAQIVLHTYLGKHAGERVLQGRIRRGDGEDIHAVLWFCDLRGSTALADRMPRKDFSRCSTATSSAWPASSSTTAVRCCASSATRCSPFSNRCGERASRTALLHDSLPAVV